MMHVMHVENVVVAAVVVLCTRRTQGMSVTESCTVPCLPIASCTYLPTLATNTMFVWVYPRFALK